MYLIDENQSSGRLVYRKSQFLHPVFHLNFQEQDFIFIRLQNILPQWLNIDPADVQAKQLPILGKGVC
jgi:hypothetical protein